LVPGIDLSVISQSNYNKLRALWYIEIYVKSSLVEKWVNQKSNLNAIYRDLQNTCFKYYKLFN